jgi:hypothetical protein
LLPDATSLTLTPLSGVKRWGDHRLRPVAPFVPEQNECKKMINNTNRNLHGITTQKIVIFIAVRASNSTGVKYIHYYNIYQLSVNKTPSSLQRYDMIRDDNKENEAPGLKKLRTP